MLKHITIVCKTKWTKKTISSQKIEELANTEIKRLSYDVERQKFKSSILYLKHNHQVVRQILINHQESIKRFKLRKLLLLDQNNPSEGDKASNNVYSSSNKFLH